MQLAFAIQQRVRHWDGLTPEERANEASLRRVARLARTGAITAAGDTTDDPTYAGMPAELRRDDGLPVDTGF